MAEELPIAIIGAGLTGLLLAQGLEKRNLPFSIYEAETVADYSRSREWGMSIQWALSMLPDLLPDEIMAGLKAACCDPYFDPPNNGCYMPVYNGETGEHIKDVPLVKYLRVSRSKMRKLLTSGLNVQYGKAFRSADFTKDTSSVLITFEDGTSATVRLLVAADGANSAVRRSLFPDD